nr:hypothetical protein [uncultured Dysosmobacter sp.]
MGGGFFCQTVEKPQAILCVLPRILKSYGRKRPVQPPNKNLSAGSKQNALSRFSAQGELDQVRGST